MSTNLSPEQHLAALVLIAPTAKPYTDAEDMRPYCALRRAAISADFEGDLIDFAMSLGFSRAQSRGIMRGWDRARGARPCFDAQASAWRRDNAIGEAVGMRMHALVNSP